MKLPKEVKRFCPKCGKRTMQKISVAKQKSRSATHPMSRFSDARLRSRGVRSGGGNKGKYSKPAIKSWKRKSKSTKRMTLMYLCGECNFKKIKNHSVRTSRIEIGTKVSK